MREFKELGESEQALLPIEEDSLVAVETPGSSYSGELTITSDLAEGEAVLAFEPEPDEALLEQA